MPGPDRTIAPLILKPGLASMVAVPLPSPPSAAEVATNPPRRLGEAPVPITVRGVIDLTVLPPGNADLTLVTRARSYAERLFANTLPPEVCPEWQVDQSSIPEEPIRLAGLTRSGGPSRLQRINNSRRELASLAQIVLRTKSGGQITLGQVDSALDSLGDKTRYVAVLNAMRPRFGLDMRSFSSTDQRIAVLKLIVREPDTVKSLAHALYETCGPDPRLDVVREIFAQAFS